MGVAGEGGSSRGIIRKRRSGPNEGKPAWWGDVPIHSDRATCPELAKVRRFFTLALVGTCATGVGATVAKANESERARVVEATCDDRGVTFHMERAREILDHGYRHARWDERRIITRSENRRWRAHRDCLSEREKRERINTYKHRVAASREDWRRRRELEFRRRHTPYDCGSHGHFAIPCAIVHCESRFDFQAKNRWSTAGGAYQIIDSTWYRNGGKRYDSRYPAAKASPREQHVVARRVWEREGRGSWEC